MASASEKPKIDKSADLVKKDSTSVSFIYFKLLLLNSIANIADVLGDIKITGCWSDLKDLLEGLIDVTRISLILPIHAKYAEDYDDHVKYLENIVSNIPFNYCETISDEHMIDSNLCIGQGALKMVNAIKQYWDMYSLIFGNIITISQDYIMFPLDQDPRPMIGKILSEYLNRLAAYMMDTHVRKAWTKSITRDYNTADVDATNFYSKFFKAVFTTYIEKFDGPEENEILLFSYSLLSACNFSREFKPMDIEKTQCYAYTEQLIDDIKYHSHWHQIN